MAGPVAGGVEGTGRAGESVVAGRFEEVGEAAAGVGGGEGAIARGTEELGEDIKGARRESGEPNPKQQLTSLWASNPKVTTRDLIKLLDKRLPWPVGVAVVVLVGVCVCEAVLLVLFLAGKW